jgi:hypothetical protein
MKLPLIKFLGLVFAACFIVLQQLPVGEIQTDYIEKSPSVEALSNDSLVLTSHRLDYLNSAKYLHNTQIIVDEQAKLNKLKVYLKQFLHQEPHAFRCFIQEYLTALNFAYDKDLLVAYLHQDQQVLLFEAFSIIDSPTYQFYSEELSAQIQQLY